MALILCFPDEPFVHDESETSSVDLDGEMESLSDDYEHNTYSTSEDSDEGPEFDEHHDFGVASAARTFWGNLSTQRGSSYEDEEEQHNRQLIASDLDHLRHGFPYVVVEPLPTSDARWDYQVKNLYPQVQFNDGQSWFVMLRLGNDTTEFESELEQVTWSAGEPPHPRGMVVSEVLSLQAMRKAGVALVPNAYLPKSDGVLNREIASSHFYCDVMPGSQCEPDLFPVDYFARTQELPTDSISRKILLQSFIESYADHQIQLSRLRFESMCRLEYSQDGEVVEGPILIEDHPVLSQRQSGPFTSLGAFHIARIEYLLHALRDVHHRDGREWTIAERLRYLTLLECKKWLKMSVWLNKDRHDFYLRHQQDFLGNYLVKDGKLSCVLEWQGSYSTIKEEAFGSPQFMRSRTSSVRECLDSELSEAEKVLIKVYLAKGRGDLAGCVEGAKIYRALWQVPEAISEVYRYKKILQVDDGVLLPICKHEWLSSLWRVDYCADVGVVEDCARSALSTGMPV